MLEGLVGCGRFSVMSTEFGVPNPKLKCECAVGKGAAGLSPEPFFEVLSLRVAGKDTADDKLPEDGKEVTCSQLEVST